jgi:hypothetical protein
MMIIPLRRGVGLGYDPRRVSSEAVMQWLVEEVAPHWRRPPDAAVRRATIDEPWHWWGRGRISGWTRTADGGLRFVLWPAWLRSPSRVDIIMSPPAEIAGADGRRRVASAATFFANFEGPGRYDVGACPIGWKLRC